MKRVAMFSCSDSDLSDEKSRRRVCRKKDGVGVVVYGEGCLAIEICMQTNRNQNLTHQ